MRKILSITLVLLIYSNVANSQWYERSCGVTDIRELSNEDFDCLWNKASKTSKAGSITTIVGSSIIVLGGVQALIVRTEGAVWNAVFLAIAGGIIDLVGAPIWITGVARKNNLKKSPHYQDLALRSVKINPIIGLDQMSKSHYVGVNISLRF